MSNYTSKYSGVEIDERLDRNVNAGDYFNTYLWTGGVTNAVVQGNSASYYSYINIKYIK